MLKNRKNQRLPEVSPNSLTIDGFASREGLSEDQVLAKIESGEILARVINQQILVFSNLAALTISESQERPSTEQSPAPALLQQALQRITAVEQQLSSQSRDSDSSDQLDKLKAELTKKDLKIKKLHHDLEDLTTLTKALESSLSRGYETNSP